MRDPVNGAVACRWHDGLVDAADAVMVGAIERGSGPPLCVYACAGCSASHDLLPLVEHPASSDGSPRTRTGVPILGPSLLVSR
jgi:hypothetical protein